MFVFRLVFRLVFRRDRVDLRTYKVYNVIYCIDNKRIRTKVNKESQSLVAVPIDQRPIDDTICQVASFVYVPFEALMSIPATMTKGAFIHYVLKHKVGDTFRQG